MFWSEPWRWLPVREVRGVGGLAKHIYPPENFKIKRPYKYDFRHFKASWVPFNVSFFLWEMCYFSSKWCQVMLKGMTIVYSHRELHLINFNNIMLYFKFYIWILWLNKHWNNKKQFLGILFRRMLSQRIKIRWPYSSNGHRCQAWHASFQLSCWSVCIIWQLELHRVVFSQFKQFVAASIYTASYFNSSRFFQAFFKVLTPSTIASAVDKYSGILQIVNLIPSQT